ncbi:MAG: class I SAM-dependent methyltransferase [Pseudomonadota bacterium]
MSELIDTWTTDPSEEDSMTDDHAWIWREMIKSIPEGDISSARVLDFGCNQGGFLRMLYDTRPFASGIGVDLARDRVALANAAKGDRPLSYIATDKLADAGDAFDLAFSHEVIYLMDDLENHARQIAAALNAGGHYDAVTCCHADNPLWQSWRPRIAEFSQIPVPNHSVSDIASAFRTAGFEVSISRFMAASFIPTEPPTTYFPKDIDRLETYSQWKLCFRCRKQ